VATDSNGKADSSNKLIAFAGIAATAVVGITGVGASLLISREDRNTQQALARDARVYDRRAAVYLDALSLLNSLAAQAGAGVVRVGPRDHLTPIFAVKTPSEETESALLAHISYGEKRVRVRLLAYGSDAGYSAYAKAIRALKHSHVDLALGIGGEGFKLTPAYRSEVGTFFAWSERFATIVHRELGGG
jgi:hypothetical protein